jgi:hypothetical protein
MALGMCVGNMEVATMLCTYSICSSIVVISLPHQKANEKPNNAASRQHRHHEAQSKQAIEYVICNAVAAPPLVAVAVALGTHTKTNIRKMAIAPTKTILSANRLWPVQSCIA